MGRLGDQVEQQAKIGHDYALPCTPQGLCACVWWVEGHVGACWGVRVNGTGRHTHQPAAENVSSIHECVSVGWLVHSCSAVQSGSTLACL